MKENYRAQAPAAVPGSRHFADLAGARTQPGAPEILSPGVVDVKVEKAADLDEAIQDAVTRLLEAATEYKTGIMVTRVGVGRYTVQTHSEVPFGLIRQRHV